MITNERRIDTRTLAGGLKFELQTRYWFGLINPLQIVEVSNFSINGAAIVTPIKLKMGQRLYINILSEFHSIKRIPAEVVRCNTKREDYHYGIRFNINKLPDIASKNALHVLDNIQYALNQSLS